MKAVFRRRFMHEDATMHSLSLEAAANRTCLAPARACLSSTTKDTRPAFAGHHSRWIVMKVHSAV